MKTRQILNISQLQNTAITAVSFRYLTFADCRLQTTDLRLQTVELRA